jgi:phage gpG-like protein
MENEAPVRAAYAMARAYHKELSDVTLVRSSHARGTPTPAAPGEPPALISGGLKRSLRLYPAVMVGFANATAKVRPLIIYARIQELGGTIVAKHAFTDKHGRTQAGYLRFKIGGKYVFKRSVKIPARPYMAPTRRAMIIDGRLKKAASDAVEKVLRSVV